MNSFNTYDIYAVKLNGDGNSGSPRTPARLCIRSFIFADRDFFSAERSLAVVGQGVVLRVVFQPPISYVEAMGAFQILFAACLAYGVVGLSIAIAFLAVGLERVDAAARGAYAFRALLLPGCVLLWPLVLSRWIILARSSAS